MTLCACISRVLLVVRTKHLEVIVIVLQKQVLLQMPCLLQMCPFMLPFALWGTDPKGIQRKSTSEIPEGDLRFYIVLSIYQRFHLGYQLLTHTHVHRELAPAAVHL